MLEMDPADSYVRELPERYDLGPAAGYPSAHGPSDPYDLGGPYQQAQYQQGPYQQGPYGTASFETVAFETSPLNDNARRAGGYSYPPVTGRRPAARAPKRAPSKRGRQKTSGPRRTPAAIASLIEPRGRRGTRKKRSSLRRMGLVYPIGAAAIVIVAGMMVVASLVAPKLSGTGGVAAFEAITNSKALAALEAERQTLIDMHSAAETYTVSSKPKVVSPSQVVALAQAAANDGVAASSSSTATSDGPAGSAPDPGSAEAIAYTLLPSYGFSQSTQWGCLYDIWQRESDWVYDAENASGAYGIPQSLPAGKMATAGSDYLTDPRTQIIWGLGYIQATYGSPCAAWDFELANGYY